MNPKSPIFTTLAAGLTAAGLLLLAAIKSEAAGPFSVTSTADSHVSNTNLGTDANGNITLRSAIEAANADGGSTTIFVPPGTYNLTLGELDLASNGHQTNVIQASFGGTNSNIFISQTDASNRVFNIDKNSSGQTVTTLAGFTIEDGHDGADNLGGAGILDGSTSTASPDSLTLDGCFIQNNHCVQPASNPAYTANPGGGVQMGGGNLAVNSCVFSNNSSGAAFGGALFFFNPVVNATLTVSNSQFVNNSATNNSSSGPDGGGAIMIGSTAGSVHTISACTFTGNTVVGSAGDAEGGAIQMNTGTLNISSSTFSNNSVSGTDNTGGALYGDSGNFNLIYCRIVNNSATIASGLDFHDANGASGVVNNDWWGVNTSPPGSVLVGANASTYLTLNCAANPSLFPPNTSTTLVASMLTNSAGTTIAAGNLGAMTGVPVAFGNAVKGTITNAQATIQSSGTATALFTAGNVAGPASATATVDSATATASFEIECPMITGSMGSGSIICQGNATAVSVSLSGGIGPYTVTLNNGGGTETSNSPVIFTVSPSATTAYAVSSASDSEGCPATVTGSTTVTVDPLPTATITPNPASVCEYSTGNQASAPSGLTGYGWTIINGTITSGVNSQTVTYTAGGLYYVTLSLMVTNSSGCVASNSALVPVNLVPGNNITLTPAVVSANTPGNQASVLAGLASYAWTITNGTITSATNVSAITYVSGMEGTVGLGVTLVNASGCSASASAIVPITLEIPTAAGWSFRTNYYNTFTFTDGLPGADATMTLAFDGSHYWSCAGGNPNEGYAEYTTNGALIATNDAGIDFRSIFTDGNGTVLARGYNTGIIYEQTSPGVFAPSGVTLTNGTLNSQSSVVMDGTGTEYLAMYDGTVSEWGADGNFLTNVTLQGYGALSGEGAGNPARGIAAFGDFWLTYNGAGIVSVWDTFGNRRLNITLTTAGTSASSDYSFSYCNGMVFIVDSPGGTWRGYDVGSPGKVAVYGAPNTASWNTDVQSKILGTGNFVEVDPYLVSSGYSVPTITNLQYYEAALVYSDASFSDATDLGNALATYVSEGGGVVLATFGLSQGFGIAGNLVTSNDLPFTLASDTSGTTATMVEDVPTHQIFTGVTSFNGGTSSYQDEVAITNGGTQLAHWTTGYPLIGVKDIEPGRTVGLNFYPPSSDARSDFWVSSTSGGLLMGNSLLWAGKVPPLIVAGPDNQVKSVGGSASFTVSATGLPPLTYQWYVNGSNIAGATKSALSFTDQSGSNGQYSVIVSNNYGVAISDIGNLNSPIHFLPFAVTAGGTFSIYLGTVDGSPLTAYRASRINIYTSTSLLLPIDAWMPLANEEILTNGLIWVPGLSATNSKSFYQAVETQ